MHYIETVFVFFPRPYSPPLLPFRIFIRGPEFGFPPPSSRPHLHVGRLHTANPPVWRTHAHDRAAIRDPFDSPGDLFTVKPAELELEDTPEHSG